MTLWIFFAILNSLTKNKTGQMMVSVARFTLTLFGLVVLLHIPAIAQDSDRTAPREVPVLAPDAAVVPAPEIRADTQSSPSPESATDILEANEARDALRRTSGPPQNAVETNVDADARESHIHRRGWTRPSWIPVL